MSADDKKPAGSLGPDAAFRDYLSKGEFRVQRFADGAFVFPPRIFNPASGETQYTWEKASGGGTVYSTSIVRQRPDKGGDYNVALIDLDEGPRMMSRVVGITPDEVKIGMKVKAKVGDVDGKTAVVFEKA